MKKLILMRHAKAARHGDDDTDEEALTSFVKQYYARAGSVPPRVLVPFALPDTQELQSFLAAFLGMGNEDTFKPALLTNDDGVREPVYVIEDKGFDHVVVMQPWTPTPFAGALKIVPKEKVELLPITLDEFSLSLTHFGLGLADIVAEHSEN